MNRGFVLLVEPAEYTLDLIGRVYRPYGFTFAFIRNKSLASNTCADASNAVSLEAKSVLSKFTFAWRSLRTFDFFIFHDYSSFATIIFLILNHFFFRKPHAFDVDSQLRIPKNLVKRFFKYLYLSFLFRRATAFGLAGGNFTHKDFFRHYGMEPSHIGLAPMMIDVERYMRGTPALRKGRPFRFIYCGRLVPHKQVDRILECFSKLRQEGLDVELQIVGEGLSRTELESRFGGMPGVIFSGALFNEAKVKAFHQADTLILFSAYEPWGLVVNEALASTLPCIVSDCVGAVSDLISGKDPAGIVVPWNDISALEKAMRELVCDEALYLKFQQNALRRMSVWNFEFYKKSFDSLLEKMTK